MPSARSRSTAVAQFAFADPDERFELLIGIFADGLSRRAAQLLTAAPPTAPNEADVDRIGTTV